MNKYNLRERYERFKEWQHDPIKYNVTSNKLQHCNNCGHDFMGNYCPICSQRAGMGDIGWNSVRQSVMDVWGLGTRSLINTISQLLLRPGYLINDYINGKRQVSYPPVKMLFIVALLYSLLYYWLFPDYLGIKLDETEVEKGFLQSFYQWYKSHYSLSLLITSILAILPTWVMFRYSPRNTYHTLPKGFFIQVFFQVLLTVIELLLIPLAFIDPQVLLIISSLVVMIYYIIGYRQLFGYGIWGTLWRQGFVFISATLFGWVLILIAFNSGFMESIPKEVIDAHGPLKVYLIFLGLSFSMAVMVLTTGFVINYIATRLASRRNQQLTFNR